MAVNIEEEVGGTRGPGETRSPSRSVELFGEEDDHSGSRRNRRRRPRSCVLAPGITIKGTTGATMELGELPRNKNTQEKRGGSRRRPACVHVGAGGVDVDPD